MKTLHTTASEVQDAITFAQNLPQVKDMLSHMTKVITDDLHLSFTVEDLEKSVMGMVNIWYHTICDVDDQTVAMAALQASNHEVFADIYTHTIKSMDDDKHSDIEVIMAKALSAKIYQTFLLLMPYILHQLEWDSCASYYDEVRYVNDLNSFDDCPFDIDDDYDEDDYHEI